MPDEKECTCSWLQKAQAAGIVIGAVFAGIAALRSDQAKDTTDRIHHTQGQQVERVEKVQKTLADQAQSTVKIEKTVEAVQDTLKKPE